MHVSRNRIRQLLRIFRILLKDLTKHRKINLLRNAKASRLTVNKVRNIHHHIGKHFHKPFLCLYPYKRNRGILNHIRHFHGYLLTLCAQHFSAKRINNILRQNLIANSVFQRKLFVKFITANLRKIISPRVKEHCRHKIFCTVQTERLTRTDFAVKLL